MAGCELLSSKTLSISQFIFHPCTCSFFTCKNIQGVYETIDILVDLCSIEIVFAAVNRTVIWGILNHCFRKFEVKCRYAQYKILTSEIIDLKNYFLFYVPSRLFLQRLIVPWVQWFDEFLITVFEIWRKVSLCKVQNINEWNDSSAIISSSSV